MANIYEINFFTIFSCNKGPPPAESSRRSSDDEAYLPGDVIRDISEDSIEDDVGLSDASVASDGEITYEVIKASTQRGHPKLIDSLGFTYTLKTRTQEKTYWIT